MASVGHALVLPAETDVGDRVRLARVALGWSRKEMAVRLGLSIRTYDRIEEGARELRVSELNALVAVTGQDAAFFGASQVADRAVLPPPLPAVKDAEAVA